jgi:thioredoxin-related protein
MKSAFFVLLLLLTVKANCQEINFIDQDWNKAVALSKAQHKPMFVDFYTDWCVWCKQMDKTTYKDKEVVDYVNANFIPVKVNAEKDYGMAIAMKYRILGYPSFAYITEDGLLSSKTSGYLETSDFLKEIKEKSDDIKKGIYLKGISSNIDLDFPQFYKNLFAGQGKRKRPANDTVINFLHRQQSLTSEVAFSVISILPVDSMANQYLLDHIKDYIDLYGKEDVMSAVHKIINARFNIVAQNNDKKGFEQVLQMVDKYYDPPMNDYTKQTLTISYYEKTNDWKNFVASVDKAVENKVVGDGMLNEYSWNIYEKVDDKMAIDKAIEWMSKVVASNPKYEFMDTYAAILYKAGKYSEAEEFAKKAIETGKKDNQDVSTTENLLKKIQDAKASKP